MSDLTGIAGAAPIDQNSVPDWEKIVAVNLTGAFNGIQAVVPAMKKAGAGSIVDISSIQGLMALPEFVVDGGESQCNASGGSLSALLGPQGMFWEAA